ncbi:MAG: FAD-dependent oxidoreductase [Collinsella sp.]
MAATWLWTPSVPPAPGRRARHHRLPSYRGRDTLPSRRVHHAKAEGVEVLPLVSPLEFVAGEDGSVCAVKVQKMELGEPDESAVVARCPSRRHQEIPCDVAISAIGTNANPFAKKIGGKMELNKWGYIVADEETGQTTDPRIWAGGDIVTGAATVILAMGAGKKPPLPSQEPAGRAITCSASHWGRQSPRRARARRGLSAGRPTTTMGQAPLWWLRTSVRSFCLNL